MLTDRFLKGPHYSVDAREELMAAELPPGISDFSEEDTKMPTLDVEAHRQG